MKINQVTNNSFKGYQNLLSHTVEEGDGDYFSYMAMKLNNEGKNDLDIWKGIQRDLFHVENPSNYIIFHEMKRDNQSVFSADLILLDLSSVKNRKDEGLMLRAYDLISSLTQRIINTDNHPEDGKIHLTCAELVRNLCDVTQNTSMGIYLATEAAMKKVKHYKTAEHINANIAKMMANYFKL